MHDSSSSCHHYTLGYARAWRACYTRDIHNIHKCHTWMKPQWSHINSTIVDGYETGDPIRCHNYNCIRLHNVNMNSGVTKVNRSQFRYLCMWSMSFQKLFRHKQLIILLGSLFQLLIILLLRKDCCRIVFAFPLTSLRLCPLVRPWPIILKIMFTSTVSIP